MICFLISFGCTLKTVDSIETGDKTTVKSKVCMGFLDTLINDGVTR